jgi:hypothetical protein
MLATVMHTLFDVGTLRITPGVPSQIVRMVETGQPIDQLL